MADIQGDVQPNGERKPYHYPIFTCYGKLLTITKGGVMGGPEDVPNPGSG